METISLSRKERVRLEVLGRVKSGDMTLIDASRFLGLSYRQAKRVWSRYQSRGDVGLVHRLRERGSNRQPDAGVKKQALDLYREQYSDYGPTLAAECLSEEHGVKVSVSTLRRWLQSSGLWERRRKRKLHRQRRPRREHRRELLQMDGIIRGAERDVRPSSPNRRNRPAPFRLASARLHSAGLFRKLSVPRKHGTFPMAANRGHF